MRGCTCGNIVSLSVQLTPLSRVCTAPFFAGTELLPRQTLCFFDHLTEPHVEQPPYPVPKVCSEHQACCTGPAASQQTRCHSQLTSCRDRYPGALSLHVLSWDSSCQVRHGLGVCTCLAMRTLPRTLLALTLTPLQSLRACRCCHLHVHQGCRAHRSSSTSRPNGMAHRHRRERAGTK